MTIKEFYNECVALKIENYTLCIDSEGDACPIDTITEIEIDDENKIVVLGY